MGPCGGGANRASGRPLLGDRRSIAELPDLGRATPGPAAPRTRGELRLAFVAQAGRTWLDESYQAGCLRVRLPRGAAATPSAVLINTGGGIVGGDRLSQSITWGPDAVAEVATQAAEKVYRSAGADARVETELHVAAGARAEWLPQETILFDQSRLRRSLHVTLSSQASFVGLEAVVFGRTAMGEVVRQAAFRDEWRIRRDGRLIYVDIQRLDGEVDRLLDRTAIGAGARASAVLIHASPRAGERLADLRDALAPAKGRAAASAWDGLLVTRFLAPDGQTLHHDLLPALAALRDGRDLPRVWTC